MLKKKVIAHSITNLTDARYFAGWMVDYFIFSIDSKSSNYILPQEIGTFQSWVEGPEYFLEYSKEMESNPEKFLVDLNCSGIYIPYADRGLLSNYDFPVIYAINEGELNEFLEFNSNEIAVLSTNKSLSSIDISPDKKLKNTIFYNIENQEVNDNDLLETSFDGFMVHGSPEEKVGFKSYDELDDIFEILQDF